jgi:hypothetical protein
MAMSKAEKSNETTFRFAHLIGGLSGGAISTLLVHPLDLLKIRFAG